MSDKEAREIVLKIGVEGGGATIYRTPNGSGGWQFRVGGTSIDLVENDDEVWRAWASEPAQTIDEALRSVAGDGSWIFFYPISVHPEYRMIVWELAQENARKLPEERSEMWERRKENWQRLCLKEAPR